MQARLLLRIVPLATLAPLAAQSRLATLTDTTRPSIQLAGGCALDGDRIVLSEVCADGGGFDTSIRSYRRDAAGAWSLEAERGLSILANGFASEVLLDLEGDRVAVIEFDRCKAYLLEFDGTAWRLDATFLSDAPPFAEDFRRVLVDGDRVYLTDLGDQEKGVAAGALHVYDFDGTSWTRTAKVFAFPPRAGARFGSGLAAWDDWVAVGAMDEDDPLTGLELGAVYLYRRRGPSLVPVERVAPPPGLDDFGKALAGDGERMVVAARRRVTGTGVVVELTRTAGGWVPTEEIDAPAPGADFGRKLALDRDLLVVGFDDRDQVLLYRDAGVRWSPGPVVPIPPDYVRPGPGPAYLGLALDLERDRLLLGAPLSAVPDSPFSGPFYPSGSAFLLDVSAARQAPSLARVPRTGAAGATPGERR